MIQSSTPILGSVDAVYFILCTAVAVFLIQCTVVAVYLIQCTVVAAYLIQSTVDAACKIPGSVDDVYNFSDDILIDASPLYLNLKIIIVESTDETISGI